MRTDGLAVPAARSVGAVDIGLKLLSFGPVLILILLFVIISAITPNFLKPINLGNILAQTAVIAIVAMGQQIVILTRGIDLSVGSNLALATVMGGLMYQQTDSAIIVILTMLASGALVGLINGTVFVYGRLPHPFIITLATLSICKGLALEIAPGHTTMRGMPDAIEALGSTSLHDVFGLASLGQISAGLYEFLISMPVLSSILLWLNDLLKSSPASALIVLGVAMIVLVMTKTMVWGRWVYSVGGSPDAARGMGIPVKGMLVSAYVLSGLFAGIGAVVLAGRTAASSPLYGNLLELDTIAAVIIGGASFLGGRGHLGHALVGAVMIGIIRNALNLHNVDAYFQMIAIGLIIVLAVEADVLRNHLEAKSRTQQAGGGR